MGGKKGKKSLPEEPPAEQTAPVRITRSSARKLSSTPVAEIPSECSTSGGIDAASKKTTRRSLRKSVQEEDFEKNFDNMPVLSMAQSATAEDSHKKPNSEVDYDVAASAYQDDEIKEELLSEPPFISPYGKLVEEETEVIYAANVDTSFLQQCMAEAAQMAEVKEEIMSSEVDRFQSSDVYEGIEAETSNNNEEHLSETVQTKSEGNLEPDVEERPSEAVTIEESQIVNDTIVEETPEEKPNIGRPFTPPPQLLVEHLSPLSSRSAVLSPSKALDLERSLRPPADPEKTEQAKAIAEKFARDMALRAAERAQKEAEAVKQVRQPSMQPVEEKPIVPVSSSATTSERIDKNQSPRHYSSTEHSRSHSRRRSSTRSRSKSKDTKSPMRDRRRSHSRDHGGHSLYRRTRESYLPPRNDHKRRNFDRRSSHWKVNNHRHSRSPESRYKRRSRSPVRSPLYQRSPLRSRNPSVSCKEEPRKVAKDEEEAKPPVVSTPSVEKLPDPDEKFEPPPIPNYQMIEELIYLDDKVKKNGKRVKRALESSAQCDCHLKNLNCSDDRCINRQMLLECRRCSSANCQNQRFRRKVYADVEPFYTGPLKGFGIRAKQLIPKNTFIIEYIGEVVTNELFNERIKKYAKDPNHTHHYIFEMGRKLIDATVKGNVSRFINHSCEPNAVSLKWAVPKSPQDCSRIGFFSSRDILPGEEITFDYHFLNYGKKAQSCHCGTANCKGIIGSVVDDGEDSDDDEEDEDEEEDVEEKEAETEEEKIQRELQEEQKEWESQRKINEIISAAMIPKNTAAAWAKRFVKNLVNIDEVGYKMRVLSFVKNTEHHFYQLLKRKSLFDVFASWLSPSDWSKDDMELKLEVVRLLADSEIDTSHANTTSGWTDLCCQSIEKLANAEVPSVLAVRDTMESMLETLCGREDDDDEDSEKLTNENLFELVRNTAKEVIDSKKFADEKRKCAVSKFRIPKKVKQEREAAAENPASAYEQQAKKDNVQRSERRENFYFRTENYRFGKRYDVSSYDSRHGLKRRYEPSYGSSRYFDSNKRSRVDSYESSRKHDRYEYRAAMQRSPDRYDHYKDRRRHDESGRPRTPPLPERPRSRGLLGDRPGDLIIPEDMELSDSGSPPEAAPLLSCSAQSVLPEIKLITRNLLEYRCPPIQERKPASKFAPPNNSQAIINWMLGSNPGEDTLYQQIRSLSALDRKKCEDGLYQCIRVVRRVNKDIEEEAQQRAEHEAQQNKNILLFAEAAQMAMAGKHVPKPPPPPPPPNLWYRVKNRSNEGNTYYYFSKNSNETVWELPEGEGYDDYEEVAPQPDSSADVEILTRGETLFRSASRASLCSRSDERPSSRNSLHEAASRPESRNSIASSSRPDQVKADSSKIIHSQDPPQGSSHSNLEEFGKAIQRAVKPVMWNALRSILFATTEKRNWLLKQVTKEMVKRERKYHPESTTFTDDVKKRVTKYTVSYMERKCANGGQDLFKGYDSKPKI